MDCGECINYRDSEYNKCVIAELMERFDLNRHEYHCPLEKRE